MSEDTLKFNHWHHPASGLCILCDKNIPRDKFTNISQKMAEEYKLVLLSQI